MPTTVANERPVNLPVGPLLLFHSGSQHHPVHAYSLLFGGICTEDPQGYSSWARELTQTTGIPLRRCQLSCPWSLTGGFLSCSLDAQEITALPPNLIVCLPRPRLGEEAHMWMIPLFWGLPKEFIPLVSHGKKGIQSEGGTNRHRYPSSCVHCPIPNQDLWSYEDASISQSSSVLNLDSSHTWSGLAFLLPVIPNLRTYTPLLPTHTLRRVRSILSPCHLHYHKTENFIKKIQTRKPRDSPTQPWITST